MSVGHRFRPIVGSCAVAALAVVGTGCTVEVAPSGSTATEAAATIAPDGSPPATVPSESPTTPATGSGGVSPSAVLVDSRYIPEGYTSEVVPADRRAGVVAAVTAIPTGSTVDPSNCAPQPLAADSAVLLATDPDAANLMVVVERVDARLQHLVEQWRNCGTFTVTDGTTVLQHRTEVTAAPPVATDESAALRSVIDGGPDRTTQQTVTLVAQQGDLRVTAVALGRPDTIDTAGLDALFTETVLNLQNS